MLCVYNISEKLVDLYFFINVIQELDSLLINHQSEKSKKEQNKGNIKKPSVPSKPTKRAR